MEGEQLDEWRALESRARARLQHGSTRQRYGAAVRLLIVPAFGDALSYEVLLPAQRDDEAPVGIKTVWRRSLDAEKFRTPVERLRHGRHIEPTIDETEVALPREAIESLLARARSLDIGAAVPETIGLDGVSYELTFGGPVAEKQLRWSNAPPPSWGPLREIVATIGSVVERALAGEDPRDDPSVVHVGLSSWIIQDGNYRDFEAGGTYRFPLEFHPREAGGLCESGNHDAPYLRHLGGAIHEARGRVVHATDSCWVVDFGVPAFEDSKPPRWTRIGAAVEGKVYVGIDPFFYLEELSNQPGMPQLLRDWHVRRVLLETRAPWTETNAGGRRQRLIDVPRTDAWNHGNAHYVLECELRSG